MQPSNNFPVCYTQDFDHLTCGFILCCIRNNDVAVYNVILWRMGFAFFRKTIHPLVFQIDYFAILYKNVTVVNIVNCTYIAGCQKSKYYFYGIQNRRA